MIETVFNVKRSLQQQHGKEASLELGRPEEYCVRVAKGGTHEAKKGEEFNILVV